MLAANADRPRMNPVCWLGAGRGAGDLTSITPQRRRELRSGRVAGTDEHHALWSRDPWRSERVELIDAQVHIRAAAITFGCGSRDEAAVLQHFQVMGEQVGRQPQRLAQLPWRGVGEQKAVDNREPSWITERGMHAGPLFHRQYLTVH